MKRPAVAVTSIVQPASVQPGDDICAAVRRVVDGLAKAFPAEFGEAAGAPQA